MEPGLYIVSTPIGNPEDITLRALSCLKSVDIVLCEDTRVTGQLLKYHQVEAKLEAYHEHNADEKRSKVVAWIQAGKSVALVSDAGTPLISDPGFKLVRELRKLGLKTTSLPGACAAIAALTLSGLPTNRFYFYGFLPAKASGRKKTLEELSNVSATIVFYENKVRLAETLGDIESIWGNCQVSLARELTKEYEEVRQSTVSELKAMVESHPVKGELVLMVDRNDLRTSREDQVDPLIHQYIEKYSVKEIARLVAEETGVSRHKVYARVLELKELKKQS